MSHIVFVDVTHPKAYDFNTLKQQALGGTEASVLRTAAILAQTHQISIYQKSRTQAHQDQGVSFLDQKQWNQLDHVDTWVVLRQFKTIQALYQRFPNSRLLLWIHTYKNTEYALKKLLIPKNSFDIICNSQTHAEHTNNILNHSWSGKLLTAFKGRIPVHYCYNPIPRVGFEAMTRDINKLLFLSSPNKGLPKVLQCFYWLYEQNPDLRLYVANPGYRSDAEINKHPGIIILGNLPHDQVIQHLTTSLCLFYPQDVFAETFGLIYAEANAVETPVIAHDIGSAREILHDNNPLSDANDYPQILETIKQWQQEIPKVHYNSAFSGEAIHAQWQKILSI
ncbi:glycosyltransferase [Marinicella sp. W31]|uniref:glycosyltransferase n=1 Tax=Marinicella sp. W31 TaxID=3023713 RepID=UPI0037565476